MFTFADNQEKGRMFLYKTNYLQSIYYIYFKTI